MNSKGGRPERAKWWHNAALTLVALLLVGVVLEGALRLMPVTTVVDWQPVTAETPMLKHRPNHELTYSKGPDFVLATRRWSNNYGYLNDRDYDPEAAGPLLAVVGDSYVEGLMNPYPTTFYGRLAAALGERGRVYSYGVSGAPLSQYLAWAEFVRDEFRPDALVVPIIANDFDESFRRFKNVRGFHYFSEGEGAPLLERVDRVEGWARRALLSSSLVRYLVFHLNIGNALHQLRERFTAEEGEGKIDFVGNVAVAVSPQREAAGLRAADLFLEHLTERAGLPAERILLVVDGLRPSLYDAAVLDAGERSYWGRVRNHFVAGARARGFGVIDMQPVFIDHFARHGEHFEFARDGHWNALGHRLVAERVAARAVFTELFGETRIERLDGEE